MREKTALNLKKLEEIKHLHTEIAQKILSANDKNLYLIDYFIISVLKRSLSLVSSYCILINNENILSAIPLIRLQIDSLIRLSLLNLYPNHRELIINTLDGKQLKDFKIGKQKITEKFILDHLEKIYPNIKNIYYDTSGYIHFSYKHIIHSFPTINNRTKIIISEKDEFLPDDIVAGYTFVMYEYTMEILGTMNKWSITKDNIKNTLENSTSE